MRAQIAIWFAVLCTGVFAADGLIDRQALVTRHNPVIRKVDPTAPLTVGNGGFAFTVDITGLQTFGDYYHQNGIPLETLARWCWVTDDNPQDYTLADANQNYIQADGSTISLPAKLGTPASDWLRRNPRLHPLGQISLEWDKPDGTPFVPEDVQEPEQTLDLWRGIITSKYKLGGVPVVVTTACDPQLDFLGIRIESKLVELGKLRIRLAFPRGHDLNVKNTPPLDWAHSETHTSEDCTGEIGPFGLIQRKIQNTEYAVAVTALLDGYGAPSNQQSSSHVFRTERVAEGEKTIDFGVWFFNGKTIKEAAAKLDSGKLTSRPVKVEQLQNSSAAHWEKFWRSGAVVDFSGSTNPQASKLEERIVLSQYLLAVQMAGDVPQQESGLTCNTWYGKHHTEMIWWHTAHFALWGNDALLVKNLAWFQSQLPAARTLAQSRGLQGARWAKMTRPEMHESPGGNPLIIWNQPHPIYLRELLYRNTPTPETLAKYRKLVLETADCMASMAYFDEKRGLYVLGPPLWLAQEIYDPATSQNPTYELAYWHWALGLAQQWRERLGLPREKKWDEVRARLTPLPVYTKQSAP